ncbi:hypothetical protein D3C77_514400 [compost metagenome]
MLDAGGGLVPVGAGGQLGIGRRLAAGGYIPGVALEAQTEGVVGLQRGFDPLFAVGGLDVADDVATVVHQRRPLDQRQDNFLVRGAILHQCRGIGHNRYLAQDVDHANVAGLEQLLLVCQVLTNQLVIAGALHHLSDQVLAGITELRVSVVQAGVGDAGGGRHIVHGGSLGGDRSNQSSDGGVQLVLQQDFSERSGSDLDALGGRTLQPGHL